MEIFKIIVEHQCKECRWYQSMCFFTPKINWVS